MANQIDVGILTYNVYDENETEHFGITEFALPTITTQTITVEGSGIIGQFDVPLPGMFSAIGLDMNLRNATAGAARLSAPAPHRITCVGSLAVTDAVTKLVTFQKVKNVIVGATKEFSFGSVKPNSPMEATVKLAVSYWKAFVDDRTILEIDAVGRKFVLNGVDYAAGLRKSLEG
jgi:P2 family phage contractile tail tube protein